ARMRNFRQAPNMSGRRSSDQRRFGRDGTGMGVRLPRARLQLCNPARRPGNQPESVSTNPAQFEEMTGQGHLDILWTSRGCLHQGKGIRMPTRLPGNKSKIMTESRGEPDLARIQVLTPVSVVVPTYREAENIPL